MPSWRLPAARLERARCRTAICWHWNLCTLFALLLSHANGLAALGLAALWGSGLYLLRRDDADGELVFDGVNWWLVDDAPTATPLSPVGPAFCSAWLVAATLACDTGRLRLVLWRSQVNTEHWRRLRLALRYGTRTVSTAPVAISG